MADRRIRVASPAVIDLAEKRKVDIVQIAAAKSGAPVTADDVSNEYLRRELAARLGLPTDATQRDVLAGVTVVMAAKKRSQEAIAAARADAPAPVPVRAPTAHPKGPEYALNPLVDQARVMAAQGHTFASMTAPPTLFASGDLPAFTASGIPPAALMDVPWQARHAMASATTPADAYAIAEQATEDHDGSAPFANHAGNTDYRRRVDAWRLTGMSDADVEVSGLPGAGAELARRESERLAGGIPAEEEAAIDDIVALGMGIRGVTS